MKNQLKFVNDVSTVEEFVDRYYKPERMHEDFLDPHSREYFELLVKSRVEDIGIYGYTLISSHDSVTGGAVYFKPTELSLKKVSNYIRDKK